MISHFDGVRVGETGRRVALFPLLILVVERKRRKERERGFQAHNFTREDEAACRVSFFSHSNPMHEKQVVAVSDASSIPL